MGNISAMFSYFLWNLGNEEILAQKLCIVGNDKSDFFNRMSLYVDSVIDFLLGEN
jgi:hypothetical protein